jgi:hypothetical protein
VDTLCPSPQSRSTAWHRRRMFLSRFGAELESVFCTRHRRDSWQFSKILATTPCGCFSTSVDAVFCHVSIGYWLLICDDGPSREDLLIVACTDIGDANIFEFPTTRMVCIHDAGRMVLAVSQPQWIPVRCFDVTTQSKCGGASGRRYRLHVCRTKKKLEMRERGCVRSWA